MRSEAIVTMHGTFRAGQATVRPGGAFSLIDLACEACGKIPENGDTIHVTITGTIAAPTGLTVFLCDACYKGQEEQ